MLRHDFGLLILALCLLAVACAGEEGATVLVELRTDLIPGVEFASVRTSLENPAQQRDRSVVRGESFADPRRVAELTGIPLGDRVLTVRLVDIDGREVAIRRARIALAADIGVTLSITRTCVGVSCGASETCAGGACVSDRCIEGVSAELCEPECATASECAPRAACSEARCEAGLCLYAQRPDACSPAEYCDVASGCVDLPAQDAGVPDAGAMDTGTADTGPVDSGAVDSGLDAGEIDAGSPFACTSPPDPATVAFYRMDSFGMGQLTDATMRHHAALPEGTPDMTTGPLGCGRAYGGRPSVYGVVPASADFQLAEGSIDFRWRPPAVTMNATAIMSRDAAGSALAGHLTIFHAGETGRLVVRIQDRTTDLFRCTEAPVSSGVWHHVGVNFGPGGFALYLDGVEQLGTGTWRFDTFDPALPCGLSNVNFGLDGNDNPWVIGGSTANSTEGTADVVTINHLGELDEVRISSARRDFAVLAP